MAMAMDGSNPEDLGVGCLLFFKTTLGEEFEAQVIAFDRVSNMLLLQDPCEPAAPRRNIKVLKANYVKEFIFLGQKDDPLDLSPLRAPEEAAIRQAGSEVERIIEVDVTSEAQSIFDALSKTLPVCWDKTAVIVVMDEVRISSPYLPESVIGGTPAANERVKRVVELERERLQLRRTSGQ